MVSFIETKKPDPEAWTEVKRRRPSSSKPDTKVHVHVFAFCFCPRM